MIPQEYADIADSMISQALGLAYGDEPIPDGVLALLRDANRPGRICCIFFSGRSGSYFAQSFFDGFPHPQVLTAHPAALASYESLVTETMLADFNAMTYHSAGAIDMWCAKLFQMFSTMFTAVPSQPSWDNLCAPEIPFKQLVVAQLLLNHGATLTHERLLKILMISYRLARGGPLDCDEPLTFIWQAHTPSKALKLWIRNKICSPILLTVVRFPEKALDSHLIHHAFETVSPPTSTLLRRLLFDHMAENSEMTGSESDGIEYAIRFEDLHHHTQVVLRSLCGLFGVPYRAELCDNDFTMQALDRHVAGVRKLTPDEFACRLLNHYDRLKVRFLLQEEYRAWGYADRCEHGLDASLQAYRKEVIARTSPFGVQALLADLEERFDSWSTAVEIKQQLVTALGSQVETRKLHDMFNAERNRRSQGVSITPLLYSLEDLAV